MNDFHFLRPVFLLFIIPLVLLLFVFFRRQKNANGWHRICKKDLLPHILVSQTKGFSYIRFLSFFTILLLIMGLAGPSWHQVLEPVFKRQSSLVIVLDLSDAMNADDIKPSRLKRAVYKINDLLGLRKDGQTALLVFSANPFVVTPLTDDIATIQAQLPALETNIMPAKGHRVDLAIVKALDLLKQTGVSDGSILLVTSALSPVDMAKTIELLKETKVKLAVLGVGGESTTPISSSEGGFLKNKDGSLMMTTLPVEDLKKLSSTTHSIYRTIALDDSDIQQLANEFSAGFSDQHLTETALGLKKWQDQGYLLVLLAIPLVSLIFRKGILIILLFIMPYSIEASLWSDYFQTSDSRGEELYKLQDYEQAKETFENTDWKATSHYQLKEYKQAAELFQLKQTADGLYNYGTARAKQGDLEQALDAYSKVLEIKPDHEDALYNKNIIEEYQKQQKSDQEQKKDNKDEKNDKNSKDKDDDKEGGDEKSGPQDKDQEGSESEDESQPDKENNKDQESKDNEEIDDQSKDDYRDQLEKELSENEDKNKDEEKPKNNVEDNNSPTDEDLQNEIDERWLQHVKDDPGGLLRRKFMQQYKRTNGSKR